MVKNPLANEEQVRDIGSNPGWERSPGGGQGNPFFRILAWRTPWTVKSGRLQSIRSQSQTQLKRLSMHVHKI